MALVAMHPLPRAAARSAPINSLNSQVKRAHGKQSWFGTLPGASATARQLPATCDTTYCQTVPRESRRRFASCVGQPNQARNDRFSTTRKLCHLLCLSAADITLGVTPCMPLKSIESVRAPRHLLASQAGKVSGQAAVGRRVGFSRNGTRTA